MLHRCLWQDNYNFECISLVDNILLGHPRLLHVLCGLWRVSLHTDIGVGNAMHNMELDLSKRAQELQSCWKVLYPQSMLTPSRLLHPKIKSFNDFRGGYS